MTAPDRIALRWELGAAVTSGPMMDHPDYTRYVRADLARPTPLAEALAWIKKHGVHADDCETVTRQDESQFSFYEMQDHLDAVSAICTCGLTAILRAAGEGRADG